MSGVTDAHRKEVLAQELVRLVAQRRLIESRSDFSAVLVRGNPRRPLTIRELATVDEEGRFSLEQLPYARQEILTVVGVAGFVLIAVVLGVILG
jgi:hypothetical protein